MLVMREASSNEKKYVFVDFLALFGKFFEGTRPIISFLECFWLCVCVLQRIISLFATA